MYKDLTPRQHETWSLIAQGYTNDAIAKLLTIKKKSVENNVHDIYDKLGISNLKDRYIRVEATIIFLKLYES